MTTAPCLLHPTEVEDQTFETGLLWLSVNNSFVEVELKR
jgi:hypothetical protein